MNDASILIDITDTRSQEIGSGDHCWITVAVVDPALVTRPHAIAGAGALAS